MTPEEILDKLYEELESRNYKKEYSTQLVIQAMKEFGKLVFEAGRTYHLHNSYLYENFDEYLKELYGEK